MSLGSMSAVVYHISSKSDDFSLRYGDLTIFKMAAVHRLDFENLQFMSCCLCRHAVLLPGEKFAEIVTVIGFNICCSVPNFINIGRTESGMCQTGNSGEKSSTQPHRRQPTSEDEGVNEKKLIRRLKRWSHSTASRLFARK